MKSLSHSELISTLDYNPKSGEFRWKKRNAQCISIGDEAGCLRKRDGYRIMCIKNVFYLAHRLAWFYVHKVWPRNELDHIDRNPSNNSISNLREATSSQQQGNKRLNRNNSSGARCVSRKRKKWKAELMFELQRHYLGVYPTVCEASRAIDSMLTKLRGEFYSPVSRHASSANDIKLKKSS